MYLAASGFDVVKALEDKANKIRAKLIASGTPEKDVYDVKEYQDAYRIANEAEKARKEVPTEALRFDLDVQITPRMGYAAREDSYTQEELIGFFEKAAEISKAHVDIAGETLEFVKERDAAIRDTLDLLKKDKECRTESEKRLLFDAEMKEKEQRRRKGIDETVLAMWKQAAHDQYDRDHKTDEQIETFEFYGRLYLQTMEGRTNKYRIGWAWMPNYECFTNREYNNHNSWISEQRSTSSYGLPEPSGSFPTYEEALKAYNKKRNEMLVMAKEQLTKELNQK